MFGKYRDGELGESPAFSKYNGSDLQLIFVPGGSAMRILVPWKPVVLVWGMLSGMILVSFIASSLLPGQKRIWFGRSKLDSSLLQNVDSADSQRPMGESFGRLIWQSFEVDFLISIMASCGDAEIRSASLCSSDHLLSAEWHRSEDFAYLLSSLPKWQRSYFGSEFAAT